MGVVGIHLVLLSCYGVASHMELFATETDLKRQKRINDQAISATDVEAPWIVHIARTGGNGQVLHCTGSFIDAYGTIITAAHCVQENQTSVTSKLRITATTLIPIGAKGYLEYNGNDRTKVVPYYPPSLEGKNVDIALIHLDAFIKKPLLCTDDHTSSSQAILISNHSYEMVPNRTTTFSGFYGAGSYTYMDEHEVEEIERNPECEAKLVTLDHARKYGPIIGTAHDILASIRGQKSKYYILAKPADNLPRGKTYHGVCSDDAGGSFVVKDRESGKLMLLGVLTETNPDILRATNLTGAQFPCIKPGSRVKLVNVAKPEVKEWIEAETLKYRRRNNIIYSLDNPLLECVSKENHIIPY